MGEDIMSCECEAKDTEISREIGNLQDATKRLIEVVSILGENINPVLSSPVATPQPESAKECYLTILGKEIADIRDMIIKIRRAIEGLNERVEL